MYIDLFVCMYIYIYILCCWNRGYPLRTESDYPKDTVGGLPRQILILLVCVAEIATVSYVEYIFF